MKNKWKTYYKSIVIGLWGLCCFLGLLLIAVASLPLVSWTLFYMCANNDTIYAVKYKEEVFDAVDIGMPAKKILDMLGEPLDRFKIDSGSKEVWAYSASPDSSHYHLRQIIIDQNTLKVLQICKELYVD